MAEKVKCKVSGKVVQKAEAEKSRLWRQLDNGEWVMEKHASRLDYV